MHETQTKHDCALGLLSAPALHVGKRGNKPRGGRGGWQQHSNPASPFSSTAVLQASKGIYRPVPTQTPHKRSQK